MKLQKLFYLCIIAFFSTYSFTQQVPDLSFTYAVKNPAYPEGQGPVVFMDEGHNNFHKLEGRYSPFAKLLRSDGYVLESSTAAITLDHLNRCKIFLISDPMSDTNESAYKPEEISAMKKWVENGGSLLLITDHFPDPPAISDLARAFGIEVQNSYVLNSAPGEDVGPIFFRRIDHTLKDHQITRGRKGKNEEVKKVVSFTGCAFRAGRDFIPLMVLGQNKTAWMTKEADKFPPDTPKIDVEGWLQGGVMKSGRGRMAFFSEAGMFTAQVINNRIRFGMNTEIGNENPQFLLNLFHWLSGII